MSVSFYINENVLYFVQSLDNCQEYCSRNELCLESLRNKQDIEKFDNVLQRLNFAIDVCLHCVEDVNRNEKISQIKYQIISYLFIKFVGIEHEIPSPKLSINLIIQLMIDNSFEDFVKVILNFNEDVQQNLVSQLVDSLFNTFNVVKSSDGLRKTYNFCMKTYLSTYELLDPPAFIKEFQKNLKHIVDKYFFQLDASYYVNECLKVFCKILNIEPSKENPNNDLLKQKFVLNFTEFDDLLCVLSRQTNEFNMDVNNFKIKELELGLYLLSFLNSIKSKFTDKKNFNLFIEFIKKIFQKVYFIDFDTYFIIKHQLYGFDEIFKKSILSDINNKNKVYTIEDVTALESMEEYMSSANSLYLLVRIIDSVTDNEIKIRLKAFFWKLFNKISFNEKLILIKFVYQNEDIKKSEDGSLECLCETESFQNEFTMVFNQLSDSNIDEEQLNKIAHLVFQSFPFVLYQIIKNVVNNISQINMTLRILCSFDLLMDIRNDKYQGSSIFIHYMKKQLHEIFLIKNARLFENYKKVVKIFCTRHRKLDESNKEYQLMNPEQFYDYVVKPRLQHKDKDSIDYLVYALELCLDDLVGLVEAKVSQLVYMVELFIYSSSEIASLREKSYSLNEERLNKCIIVKRLTYDLIKKISSIENIKCSNEELAWLMKYINAIDWKLSLFFSRLTRTFVVPSSLKGHVSINDYMINYIDTQQTAAECLLEIVMIGEILKFNIEFSNWNIFDNMGQFMLDIIKVLDTTKIDFEFTNLLNYLLSLIEKDMIQIEIDDVIANLLNNCELDFIKFVALLTDILFIIKDESFTVNVIFAYTKFVKDYCIKICNRIDSSSINLCLCVIYYCEKLFSFFQDVNSYQLGYLILDMSKLLCKLVTSKVSLDLNQTNLIKICKEYSKLIESQQNFKEQLIENLDIALS